MDDLPSLSVHLRFPSEHWRRIRHSNFIERTFGETRRRVKVIAAQWAGGWLRVIEAIAEHAPHR